MSSLQTTVPLDEYLRALPLVDIDNPLIQSQIGAWEGLGERERTQEVYHFVRDRIAHSWDIQACQVTAKASDVLQYGHGICYAKSHLLAALLRGLGIPTGFCYQRLTLGDTPETGFCIHALNTVYLQSLNRWIRLDARGNTGAVNAQFSTGAEQLAFPVRPDVGEREYWTNYAAPHPKIIETLQSHTDCRTMYSGHLPDSLD